MRCTYYRFSTGADVCGTVDFFGISLWSAIELTTGVVVACLPAARHVLVVYGPKVSTLMSIYATRVRSGASYMQSAGSKASKTSSITGMGGSRASAYHGGKLAKIPEENHIMSKLSKTNRDRDRRGESEPLGLGPSEEPYRNSWFDGPSRPLTYSPGLPLGSFASVDSISLSPSKELTADDGPVASEGGPDIHATMQWRPVSYPPAVAANRPDGNSQRSHYQFR